MFSYLGRLKQFCRVVISIAIELDITKERAHTTQYAALRHWLNTNVMELCREILEVLQAYGENIQVTTLYKIKQFAQVVEISVKRVLREVSLQFQVSYVPFNDICICFLCH